MLPNLQAYLLESSQNKHISPIGGGISILGYAWQFMLLLYLLSTSMPRLFRVKQYWAFDLHILVRGLSLGLGLLFLAILAGYGLPHPDAGAMPFQRPAYVAGYIPILIILTLAVMLEELLFRVYYLERLTSLGARPWAAILVAVPLFALGHQYQGLAGIVIATILGTALSWAWLRWHNYWINCLAHLLYNATILWLAFARGS